MYIVYSPSEKFDDHARVRFQMPELAPEFAADMSDYLCRGDYPVSSSVWLVPGTYEV